MFKSGFVNILGNPNVGKSTLMNRLSGERLSIITSRAQTTRHRIMGIINGDDFQIVYSDTPGIIKPKYRLQDSMMKQVSVALTDADIILYVTDVIEDAQKNSSYLERIHNTSVPAIIALNKIDLAASDKINQLKEKWQHLLPGSDLIPVSALNNINLDLLFNKIHDLLPEGPLYFPEDVLTDKTQRFFVSEIIREKIFDNYRKEIPYSVEVRVESYKEEKDIIRISAVIYVLRNSQKGILIGHEGKALKKTGTQARIYMEDFLGKKVFLELFVKVKKDWRDKNGMLKEFGYE